MQVSDIREYWNQRAASDRSVQSTTQDIFLREIEFRVVQDVIARLQPSTVQDVGCGDALTTCRLAKLNPEIHFSGCDYSSSMIRNAESNIAEMDISNISVMGGDAVSSIVPGLFDLIYTNRCLINLPTIELQVKAMRQIHDKLAPNGHYAMIENFVEGQENFNKVRREFDLPEIPIRDHNNFFIGDNLRSYIVDIFEIVEEINISSSYYMASRVIYAKICQSQGVDPDYNDPHHEWGSRLPFSGENGPVRLVLMRKR